MPPPTRAACAIAFETMSVPSVGSSPAPFALPRHALRGVGVDHDVVPQIQRQAEAIEPGTEVRRGRGDARGRYHDVTGRARRRRPPGPPGRSPGCEAPAIAHSGSFSPWPVNMHTTVAPPGASRRRGAGADRPRSPRSPARRTSPRARPAGTTAGSRGRSRRDLPLRLGRGRHRLVPRRGVADPDRRRDRLGILHRLAADDRRRSLGLEPEQLRRLGDHAVAQVLASSPASGWRCCPRCRPGRSGCRARAQAHRTISNAAVFCPCEPERVDRVHQGDRVALGEVLRQLERGVEVPVDLQDAARRARASAPSCPGRSCPSAPAPRT